MTFWISNWDQLLKEDICWEGKWSNPMESYCKKNGDKCEHCDNVPGFGFIPCNMCYKETSQCLLVYLCGICRYKEDHSHGYPDSALCKNCFIKAKKQMIDLRISHFPKALYEPIYKYIDEHWEEFQKE